MSSCLFWCVYITLSVCFVFVLMYTKELMRLLKRLLSTKTSSHTFIGNGLTENLLPEENIQNASLVEESNQAPIISGLIKIIFQFYQIESLLRVNASVKNQLNFSSKFFTDMLSSVFGVTINTEHDSMVICPVVGLNMIGKQFIKASLPISCLLISIFLIVCTRIYKDVLTKKKKDAIVFTEDAVILDEGLLD